MNNKAAIGQAVKLARRANRLAVLYARYGKVSDAQHWRNRRQIHTATARRLKQDAQQ